MATSRSGKRKPTPAKKSAKHPCEEGVSDCIALAGEAAEYIASHKVWDHRLNGSILTLRSWTRLTKMIGRLLPPSYESEERVSEDQADAYRNMIETLAKIWGKGTRLNKEGETRLYGLQTFDILERNPSILSRLEVALRNLAGSGHVSPRQTARKLRKGSLHPMRRKRAPKLTDKQREALRVYDREGTYTAVGKHFGISRQSATDLVKTARRNLEEIGAAAAGAGRAKGVSVKSDHKLPEDNRGQSIATDSKYREG